MRFFKLFLPLASKIFAILAGDLHITLATAGVDNASVMIRYHPLQDLQVRYILAAPLYTQCPGKWLKSISDFEPCC